ncbi:hypothetical protein [Streptococcus oralis]|jgi:hypothetical protein|uniref:hypothetical protein n=1 Tax=Streptococcus oralis TaxID=1303 RepID=UPI001EFE7C2B|nr:hypothetical protein [Streptococcus oralis]
MTNKDSFNGGTNIGVGNTAGGDIFAAGRDIYIQKKDEKPVAEYEAKVIWKTPLTKSVLSFSGILSSVASAFTIFKGIEPLINWFRNSNTGQFKGINENFLFIFLGIFLLTIIIFYLRSITSKETRQPLMFNYALSGIGNRLSVEKVEVAACPICNGKMKYYNKPIAWDREIAPNGKEKLIVTERVPALECKRNSKHWFEVDPAEDKI